jgi:hypothetical protein
MEGDMPWTGIFLGKGYAVDGDMPSTGICRGWGYAVDGDIQCSGICRGRGCTMERDMPWTVHGTVFTMNGHDLFQDRRTVKLVYSFNID